MSGQFVYTLEITRKELLTDPAAFTEEETEIIQRHFQRLKEAAAEGTVHFAGRSTDEAGEGPGFVVFSAASEEEARDFMEGDPAVASGLMIGRLYPFRIALGPGA